MKYDVDYFINKFEAIPEEKWTIGTFYDKYSGASCALGHCGRRDGTYDDLAESEELVRIFNNFNLDVVSINDTCLYYVERTPKQRIMAALYDMKKKMEEV